MNLANQRAVTHAERFVAEFQIVRDMDLPASALLLHTGIDIGRFSRVSVIVSTSASCTIRFQVSDDNTNWYEVKEYPDTDMSFNCNNEKIAIQLVPYGLYFRVALQVGTSAATVTLVVLAQV